jgi:hypothetical protein
MNGGLVAVNALPAICENVAGKTTFHNRINSLKQKRATPPKAATGLGLHNF